MTEQKDILFEEILKSVGGNGKYQQALFWLFLVPLHFMIPWTELVPIFQSTVPDHWCYVPGKPSNISIEEWKNMTIPWIENEGKTVLSKCLQFTEVGNEAASSNTSMPNTEACRSGWEYDHTWYDSTLSMQQDWVCEKDNLPSIWLSVGAAGNMFGTLIYNYLSDYMGRKPIVVITTLMYALFSIIRLYMTSTWTLMLTMFITAMAFPAVLTMSWILVLEQVTSGIRARITATTFIMWTVGMSLLPLFAWLTRSWKTLGLVTSIPFVIFILTWWFLPESPRWLISKGRLTEAYEIMKRISEVNGTPTPKNLRCSLEEYMESCHTTEKNSYLGVLDLFKYPKLRTRTLVLTLAYVTNMFVYYGLIYSSVNLSGNPFLNFFFLSITEIPANIAGWLAAQYIGRRWSQCGFVLLSVVWTAAAVFVTSSWVETAFVVTSKTMITASFLVIYLQCAEMFPTSLRSSGNGIVSISASIVGIIIPYVAYSNTYWSELPYVIVMTVGLVGGIVSSFLPETLGYDLPQTAEEADTFLKTEPYWSYRGKLFRKKNAPVNESVETGGLLKK